MMTKTLAVVAAGVGVVAFALAGPAAPPTTGPVVLPASRPVVGVAQPKQFRTLAARARTLTNVHAKGVATVDETAPRRLPEELRKVAFEVWVVPPRAKFAVDIGGGEFGVSDGKAVHRLRLRPEGKGTGRRLRLTRGNLYNVLQMAAVYRDAADGYANLAGAVTFRPIEAPAEFAEEHSRLKWFALQAAADPPHHLIANAKRVRVGIDPGDGLFRVMSAEMTKKDGRTEGTVTVTVVFGSVIHGKVKAGDLKLPAAAADADWIDGDSRKTISPPRAIIAEDED